jgi:hypothetical protein
MESQEVPVKVKVESKPRTRSRWRLQILLGFSLVVITMFVISRLEPDQAKRYGWVIESVYHVFNPPIEVELNDAGRRFIDDIRALGGDAGRIEPDRRFLGLLAPDETFVVNFSGVNFDDALLAHLATIYGDRIGALHLMNTGVTDEGLKHLKRFGRLRFLSLASPAPMWVKGKRWMPITDAGMARLDLPNLVNLNLDGLPITDAGIKSLPDLTSLQTLQLTGTQVEGRGLSRLAAFRNLATLILTGSAVTDEGLKHLAGAQSLVVLQLDGMPLTGAGLKHIIALPRLRYLSIRRSQVPSGDVAQMRAEAPALRIER